MESYVTLKNGSQEEKFYIFSDGSCKWNNIICDDFADLFLKLAELGWYKAKEINIAVPIAKAKGNKGNIKAKSKRQEFNHQWYGLIDKLVFEGNLDHN